MKQKTKLEHLVATVEHLGHIASLFYLRQLGWSQQDIELAVDIGLLEWKSDGSLKVT